MRRGRENPMVSSFTRRPLPISARFSWYVAIRAGVRTRAPAPAVLRSRAMSVTIRGLEERDLPAADRICRLAFGTFLGLPDPMTFMGDADFVGTRWRAEPSGAVAAELDGELVGSNLATRWGSFGFFGPLSVRPDLWDGGIARRLLERTMEIF